MKKLEKFEKSFASLCPVVSTYLTTVPTAEELADLERYSNADLKDACRAMERESDFFREKRNQYKWIKNKLDFLERNPMKP